MPQGTSSIAEWDAATANLMREQGLSKAQAIRQLAISNPNLHADYLAESTSATRQRMASQRGAGPLAAAEPDARRESQVSHSGQASIDAWEEVVKQGMAGGLTRQEATVAASSKHPQLRKEFVAAYNDAPNEARIAHQERMRS